MTRDSSVNEVTDCLRAWWLGLYSRL